MKVQVFPRLPFMNRKRRIKFRIWDTTKNEWFGPEAAKSVSFTLDMRPLFWTGDNVRIEGKFWPKEWVIQQFTGFYDIDGKEIYEGDLVESVYHVLISFGSNDFKYKKAEIGFVNGAFCVMEEYLGRTNLEEHMTVEYVGADGEYWNDSYAALRVVGNIFENSIKKT